MKILMRTRSPAAASLYSHSQVMLQNYEFFEELSLCQVELKRK